MTIKKTLAVSALAGTMTVAAAAVPASAWGGYDIAEANADAASYAANYSSSTQNANGGDGGDSGDATGAAYSSSSGSAEGWLAINASPSTAVGLGISGPGGNGGNGGVNFNSTVQDAHAQATAVAAADNDFNTLLSGW